MSICINLLYFAEYEKDLDARILSILTGLDIFTKFLKEFPDQIQIKTNLLRLYIPTDVGLEIFNDNYPRTNLVIGILFAHFYDSK
jgi:hypothetical protein